MAHNQALTEEDYKKWEPVLEHKDVAPIKDRYRRRVTAQVLENTVSVMAEEARQNGYLIENPVPVNAMGAAGAGPLNTAGNIAIFDPILINLVRRGVPNLIAYDIMGVQPMTGPTGMVFAMRSRYNNQTGPETFFNEVNSAFSTVVSGNTAVQGQAQVGSIPGVANNVGNGTYNYAGSMSTAQAEALGTDGNTAWSQMSFSIEKVTVTAGSRALAGEYTMELAQDLKAVHGLDAEGELSNILSTEMMAEINREAVRTVLVCAKPGSQTNTTTPGIFDLDVDSNGRWSVEKFKGLHFQIERERNQLAYATRRGRGNIMICTADVASALNAAGKLSIPDLGNNLSSDVTGPTFVGILNGEVKVYIDPYAVGGNYMVLGYRGPTPYDAGIFYCPYVPLQQVRAVHPTSFQPRIGFKTRYGMVSNPYAEGLTVGSGRLLQDSNVYYSRSLIMNIL